MRSAVITHAQLVIVGEGPDRARLESLAGSGIRFVGRLSDGKVRSLMECCRGLVLPGEEDFGIAPVEAQAAGKPVIAWACGGALETVREGETGVFFHQGTAEALADAVLRAEKIAWQPHRIRKWAETFSEERYHEEMDAILEEARTEHHARQKVRVKTRRVQWSEDFAVSPSFSANHRDVLEPADLLP